MIDSRNRPAPSDGQDRLRGYGFFVVTILYYFFAKSVSESGARGLAGMLLRSPVLLPAVLPVLILFSRLILIFLLLVGFWFLARGLDQDKAPFSAMGIPARADRNRDVATGLALGWGMVAAVALVLAFWGGLYITTTLDLPSVLLWLLDLLALAAASFCEEFSFRGYALRQLERASGPRAAIFISATLFASMHLFNPHRDIMSMLVTFLSGILFGLAAIRTRAIWLSFGMHLGWNVAVAQIFGLPLSGLTDFSPIFSTLTGGPVWLTGGPYGPEGGLLAFFALLAGIVFMMRITSRANYTYNAPVITPGGMPVDIDASARRMHDTAMASPAAAPEGPKLIQIGGIASPSVGSLSPTVVSALPGQPTSALAPVPPSAAPTPLDGEAGTENVDELESGPSATTSTRGKAEAGKDDEASQS